METTNRFFIFPRNTEPQQIIDELGRLGYNPNASIPVTNSYEYFDTQGGRLLHNDYRLRHSVSEKIWQLQRNGELILAQSADGGVVPTHGVIPDHLDRILDGETLLPFLHTRVAAQIVGLDSPSHAKITIHFEKWFFKSPFQSNWTRPKELLAVFSAEYDKEIFYLASLLRDYLGFKPFQFEPLRSGLESIDASLPGAPLPQRYVLNTDDTVYSATLKILGAQAYRMWANTDGTVNDLDPEFLHDLRVATRRARFALRLLTSYIGEELAEQLRQELSWIAKLLGRVRDIDVIQERFKEQFSRIRASATTMEWFTRYYGGKRKKNLTRLQKALVSSRYENILQMLTDIDRLIKQRGGDAGRSIVDYVPKIIEKELQDFHKWMRKSAEMFSPSDLHQLRIAFKGLRYTAEFFSDLYGKEMKKTVGQLILFQDCLGMYQDAQVTEETLDKFIKKFSKTPDDSIELILSTGALIQVQRDIQDQQRRHFTEMWIKFPKTIKNFQNILNLGSQH